MIWWKLCGMTILPEETREAAIAFLTAQRMFPSLPRRRSKAFPQPGLEGHQKESLKLWSEGYITPEDFDRAWMLEWGTPHGPFGLMDKVGLDIVEQIELTYYDESKDPGDLPPRALREMIEQGRLGEKTGRGFMNIRIRHEPSRMVKRNKMR